MPELPEVEVVRRQLVPLVDGAIVESVEVEDARALKRHPGDVETRVADFIRRVHGATLLSPVRRGKFMWIPIAGKQEALLAHLGMSGQILARTEDAPDDKHVRARIWLRSKAAGAGLLRLDFADQRRFGSLAVVELEPTADGAAGGVGSDVPLVPTQAAHIARDPLDPAFNVGLWIDLVRTKNRAIKKILLDQNMMSGVGNIYADEALWQARLHPATPGNRISAKRLDEVVEIMRGVFEKALAEGGTSFDSQYVNVNGEAGYFAHSLNAYGRGEAPCYRCGTFIKRVPFGGRSSHFCPRCQRRR